MLWIQWPFLLLAEYCWRVNSQLKRPCVTCFICWWVESSTDPERRREGPELSRTLSGGLPGSDKKFELGTYWPGSIEVCTCVPNRILPYYISDWFSLNVRTPPPQAGSSARLSSSRFREPLPGSSSKRPGPPAASPWIQRKGVSEGRDGSRTVPVFADPRLLFFFFPSGAETHGVKRPWNVWSNLLP